jgi:hypothetical protein
MKTRKELRELTAAELLAFRRAMSELQAKNGPNSFIGLAGLHGVPDMLCPNQSPIFLPWHRVYITAFENALREIDATVTLPYWDWTSQASFASGLPPSHTDRTFTDGGRTLPNPLLSGPVEDRSRTTSRGGGRPLQALSSFARSVGLAMDSTTYQSFNQRIEAPHGSIHVWVGGTDASGSPLGDMAGVARAAYDPIFWSHHTNVDRQWAIWQRAHPSGTPPRSVLDLPLPGFDGWRVRDAIDHRGSRLDFTYSGLDALPSPGTSRPDERGIVRSGPRDAPVPAEPRVIVEISGIDRSGPSFLVDVFVSDAAEADPDGQDTVGVFAGSFGIFGAQHLHHTAGHGHHHHEFEPAVQEVDVTTTVEGLGLRDKPIRVQLVASTPDGQRISPDALPVGAVAVRTVR